MDAARTGWRRLWILIPAVPLLVVCLGGTHPAGANQDNPPDALGYVLVSIAALSLLLRRRAPLAGISVAAVATGVYFCLLYTSPSPRDRQKSRMPSSA